MRFRIQLLTVLTLGFFSSTWAFESVEEALEALSSETFGDREKASRFLLEHGDVEVAGKLEKLASGSGEAALRAQRIVDYIAFGIRGEISPEVLTIIRKYRQAGDDAAKRLEAISQLSSDTNSDEIDFLRVCEYEATRSSGEHMVNLVHLVADHLFNGTEPPTERDIARLETLARNLGGITLATIARKHLQIELTQKWIGAVGPSHRAPLYNAWSELLRLEHPDGEPEAFEKLLLSLKGEPESVKRQLANSPTEPLLALEVYSDLLDLSDGERKFLSARLAETQLEIPGENISLANELSRVLFLWGNKDHAVHILERATAANDGSSIRAFATTIVLMDRLEEWIGRYEERFEAEPTSLNRRVLVQLLKASGRYEEAFNKLLPEEDAGTDLFEQLAVESGHLSEAYNALVTRSNKPGSKADANSLLWMQHNLRAAFLARHAGLEEELSRHLTALTSDWVEDEKNRHQLLQGLLIIGCPEDALEVAKRSGTSNDVFEILTLIHEYDQAFEFALDQAKGENSETGELALTYFAGKNRDKEEKLRQIVAPQIPREFGIPKAYRRPWRPAEEILSALIDGDREGVILIEEARLAKEAAKPENAALRNRLVEWWKRKSGKKQPEFSLMEDVFEAAEEWDYLAETYFDQWRKSRVQGKLLFLSGHFLEKAGNTEEGRHRQEVAALMPLAHPWMRSGLTAELAERGPEGLDRSHRKVVRLVGDGADADYARLQREQFLPLSESGDPRRAALLWASAHYQYLKVDTGIAYATNASALGYGAQVHEGLGLHALNQNNTGEAERHLAETWRLSLEPTRLGTALIDHYRSKGELDSARKVFDSYRLLIEEASRKLPEDKSLSKKLAEWDKLEKGSH